MAERKETGKGKPQGGVTRLGCLVSSCKASDQKFGFCSEHFEQYKFGLINKFGNPVPDFEKKLEHFKTYKDRKSAQRAA